MTKHEDYRELVRRIDQEINSYLSKIEEAKSKNDQDQIMYYQGRIDSLTWLKKDYGWPKRWV